MVEIFWRDYHAQPRLENSCYDFTRLNLGLRRLDYTPFGFQI